MLTFFCGPGCGTVAGQAADGPSGGSPSLSRFSYSQIHMGSKARIVLYAADEPQARAAAGAAFARLAELDAVLSDYRQNSEVSRLCAQPAGVWTPVSAELFRVLTRAREIAEASDGAFDHTVGPLSLLWRGARRNQQLPAASDLEHARARVGWRLVRLDAGPRAVRMEREQMRIDFGAIGKGFGADEAILAMRPHGVSRALVDIGGDIAVGDPPPGQSAWRIEIESGYGDGPRPVVYAANEGVATSGDTEQFVEIGGARYSHILDPRTGFGLNTRTAATVIARDAATADALASAACVLGPERMLERFGRTSGFGVRMMVDGIESRFGSESVRISPTEQNDGDG